MANDEPADSETNGAWLEAIDTWIIVGATTVGVLVNFNAVLVPLLTRIGGGVVAGFLAASAVGRITSGMVHAVIASALVGGIAGSITALLGELLGLYNEPPLLILSSVGPISPVLSGLGLPSVLLIASAFSLLTVVDGIVGGAVGSAVRTLCPW